MTGIFIRETWVRTSALADCLTILSLVAYPAAAESDNADAGHGLEAEHYHKNIMGRFTGITHEGRRENEIALGLEYVRHISEHFGIGAIGEYTRGDADLWVVAIPFSYRNDHWKFYVAPGIEDSDHGKEELVRHGAEYAFELSGGWEIAPQINVDFVDGEEVWVFGIVFARGF